MEQPEPFSLIVTIGLANPHLMEREAGLMHSIIEMIVWFLRDTGRKSQCDPGCFLYSSIHDLANFPDTVTISNTCFVEDFSVCFSQFFGDVDLAGKFLTPVKIFLRNGKTHFPLFCHS
jgi:hypothetical protein